MVAALLGAGLLLLSGCKPAQYADRFRRDYLAGSFALSAAEAVVGRRPDYPRAQLLARRALELAPDSLPVVRRTAGVFLECRAWDDMLRSLDALTRLTGVPNTYLLGAAHLYRGEEFIGSQLLREYLGTQRSWHQTGRIGDLDLAMALNNVGYAFADKGVNLREALALAKEAVALWPDSATLIDSLGWAHYRLGETRQAAFYLERALRLQAPPGMAEVYYHAGVVHARGGELRLARAELARALDLRSPYPEARYELQRLYWQLPQPATAQAPRGRAAPG